MSGISALTDGAWLEDHIGDSDIRIVEASIDTASYDAAHIPGALRVDHFADLLRSGDDTAGDVLAPAQFAALMGRLGITPESTVVAYGDRQNSYAIRLFWTLDFYQHPGRFFVLDGGRERWIAEGRPMTTEVRSPPVVPYPEPPTHIDANRATWQEVQSAIGANDKVILDVRSLDEYSGTSVRAKRGGHIPGAVHIEWIDATSGENVLKSDDELRAVYASQGVTPDKDIIAHCQLGIRAVHTWFVLKHVLGYPNVKNYDGSWAEWGNRDDLPIEV